MKIVNRIIALAVLILALASCSNEDTVGIVESNDNAKKYLVSHEMEKSCSVEEMMETTTRSLAVLQEEGILDEDFEASIKYLFQGPITGKELRFERHHFSYNTVDFEGKPLVLSGNLLFLRHTGKSAPRPKSVVELFSPYLEVIEMEKKILIEPLMSIRTIYDGAVIFPDLQGYGYDSDNFLPISNPILSARQTVDCEMAALELLKDLKVELSDDYKTYNYGVSHGGATALGIQKYLETTAPQHVRDAINLEYTACVEGPVDFAALTSNFFGKKDTYMNSLTYGPAFVLTFCEAMACDSEFAANYTKEDFFNSDFLSAEIRLNNGEVVPLFDCMRDGAKGNFTSFKTVESMLKEDMFNADGTVDLTDPRLVALSTFTKKNAILPDWTPTAEIHITHATTDDFIPYEDVRSWYETMHSKAPDKVKMVTRTHGDHIDNAFYVMFRDVFFKKKPGTV